MKNTYQPRTAMKSTIHGPVDGRKRRAAIKAPAYSGMSVSELVSVLKPAQPLYIIEPDVLAENAQTFNALFPGTAMYAVKCNPDRQIVQTLYNNGVHAFDVASLEEIKLVSRAAPKAKVYFMHPVKSPEAIRTAYGKYGVRAFVLDTQEELYKIMRETDLAADLELFVRMALPKNGSAKIDFACKFGANPDETVELLRQCRAVSAKLGLCFHVGTQTMEPAAYSRAIGVAANVMTRANVKVDVLDVGGGFPVAYPDQVPPPLPVYMKEITGALQKHGLDNMALLGEPGRALVAGAGHLVVRVEQRRGDMLYINDGTYGGLFDAGPQLQTRYPVELVRNGRTGLSVGKSGFRFAGPTCDSLDIMDGPFYLGDDVRTGDWIAIGNMGAYSVAMRTNFNGFGTANTVLLNREKAKMNVTTSTR